MTGQDWARVVTLALTIIVIAGAIVAVALFYLRVFWGALALTVTSL